MTTPAQPLPSHTDPSSYKPLLLRFAAPEQRAVLVNLMLHPHLLVFDTIDHQLAELVQSRTPADKPDAAEVGRRVAAILGGCPVQEYGVWVYYPWSRRLVHMLDEPEFIELRCDRNRNKITSEEQARLAKLRVGVVGLSVGQSVALALAMERGCGELRLADFDCLSLSNMNRIRCGTHCIGVNKSILAAREIAEIDPYLLVVPFPRGLSDAHIEDFFNGLDVLVDECDDLRMKLIMRQKAKALSIPVIMDTSDRGMLDIERFDLEPTRPILHGRVEGIDPDALRGLSTRDKVPYAMRMVDGELHSPRMIASLIEIGQTLTSWPQLASSVMLGGALATDVIRRIALGELRVSGRFYIDLEQLVSEQSAAMMAPAQQTGSDAAPGKRVGDAADVPSQPADMALARAIIEEAIQAPSGGNCQPWKWVVADSHVTLLHDTQRSASFLDFQSSAAMMSLGAALENFVLAAHHRGLHVRVQLLPDAKDPDLVAFLSLHGSQVDGAEDHTFDFLHPAIGPRCTNRKLGARRTMEPHHWEALVRAVEATPGARLLGLQTADQLDSIGRILGRGDRERFLSEQLHKELMSEVRWTLEETEHSRDGIDVRTLELSPADQAGMKLCRSWAAMRLVSRFGGGSALEKMSIHAVNAASAVGLITMPSTTRRDFVVGGRAVQRMWLQAQLVGVAVQPMSSLPYLFSRLVRGGIGMDAKQVKALRALREPYAHLFGLGDHEAEVLLVRFAYAEPVTVRSLRRTVDDVIARG